MAEDKKFNASAYFDIVRAELFHNSMLQSQVEGQQILGAACMSAGLHPLVEQAAYVLATAYHETAQTMQPIEEYGGPSTRYAPWYGRGYVQLTWEDNYSKQQSKLGKAPAGTFQGDDWRVHDDWNRAMIPDVSAAICVGGMLDGDFTGKGLNDYIKPGSVDYWNARRIVNGTDKADLIAGYAKTFERALLAGFEGMDIPTPPPPVPEGSPVVMEIKRYQVGDGLNEKHPDVRVAQSLLAGAGHDPGAIDGVAGPKFAGAVSSYQKAVGIPSTGVCDETTWYRLEGGDA